MSAANDIALAISARAATILTASGYQTNIGARTYRGRKRLDEKNLPCVVIVEREDKVLDNRPGQVKLAQPFVIEGHMKCDPDNPNDVGHKIIADIKKALFTGKFTYGMNGSQTLPLVYVGRTIAPREDGVDVVSAAVEVTVEYVEQLAAP